MLNKVVLIPVSYGIKSFLVLIAITTSSKALEEVVMAIRTRNDLMPYETGINTTLLSKASKLVSNVTGFPVQYNKAIVGKNAFAHERMHFFLLLLCYIEQENQLHSILI